MAKSIKFKIEVADQASGKMRTMVVEAKSAEAAIQKLAGTAKKASASLKKSMDLSMVSALTVNAIKGIQSAVNDLIEPYRSFETAMATANTMAGKSKEEFAALTDQVKDLSKTVPIARDELANGLYMVISNGIPEDNWVGYLEQSARAATGGVADLGKTITATSTIIKNYGASWSDAGKIQDMIQTTAKNGVTSFEQLADALPRVSGNAAKLGVSMEELMAVFATTTGVTGNTAEVSTQLAAVFTALIKPSKQAQDAAAAMGAQFDAAAVQSAGGLKNFLSELDATITAYAAKTGELSDTIYARLFGSAEALRVLGSLTGEQKEVFASNIEAMRNSVGTIDSAFEQMASTGEAQTVMARNARQSMTDWIASIGAAVAPTLSFTATLGTTLMTGIQLTSSIKAAGAAIIPYVVNAGRAIAATRIWRTVQAALNIVLNNNPIGRVIIGLTALAGAIRVAYVNIAPFRRLVDWVIDSFKDLFAVIGRVADKIGKVLVVVLEKCGKFLKYVWDYLCKIFGITTGSTPPAAESLDRTAAAAENVTDAALDARAALDALDSAGAAAVDVKLPGTAKTAKAAAAAPDISGPVTGFKTLDQYTAKLEALRRLQATATSEQYVALQKQVNEVQFLMDAFKAGKPAIKRITPAVDEATEATRRLAGALGGMKLTTRPDQVTSGLKAYTDKATRQKNDEIEKLKNQPKLGDIIGQGLQQASTMLQNISSLLGEGAQAWLGYAANVLAAVSSALPAIMALAAAEGAESAAKLPFPANIVAAAAAVAGILAAMASVPKFAEGGIAYGPTVGMFGEYSGASTNPEVVAPLSRLRELITPADTAGKAIPDVIRLVASGRDLTALVDTRKHYLQRT